MDGQHRAAIPLRPSRSCDVVMKGGVTSGVVYPPAVVELAGEYRFASIGGTSAGAIAAALTAAAEYRRRNGSTDGFERYLADLPRDLGGPGAGGKSKLYSLFQPDRSTRPIFNAIVGAIEERTFHGKAGAVIAGIFTISPMRTLIAACLWSILALCVLYFARAAGPFPGFIITLTSGLAFAAIVFAWFSSAGREILRTVGDNAFGLCRGFTPGRTGGGKPLTEWLADLIDEVAGKGDPGAPLTFGDLEGGGQNGSGVRPDEPITLRMMTTSLTHGRPYQLPFEQGSFYFDPAELRGFFPERIVRWMVEHSIPYGISKYRSMPKPAEVPVVVAARLSLSFPLLVSAVPLYAADATREGNRLRKSLGRLPELERCWFSDGGICSNFPVHLFDGPIPSRPTFAINLRPFHPDHPRDLTDESNNVWMPRSNGEGDHEHWTRLDGEGSASLLRFIEATLDTMQNWVDNTQLKVPGYRDRVAHISLACEEGGLNLDMDRELIERLTKRGSAAGAMLRDRFAGRDPECGLDWDNHRWVRYRSAMTLLEEYLGELKKKYDLPAANAERSYAELVGRSGGESPASYPWPDHSRPSMIERDRMLQEFIARWVADDAGRFGDGTPRPVPEFRIRPRL